jgi:hypothetical protein
MLPVMILAIAAAKGRPIPIRLPSMDRGWVSHLPSIVMLLELVAISNTRRGFQSIDEKGGNQ